MSSRLLPFVVAALVAAPLHAAPPAVTTDQMREVDRIMVEELGITLTRMMENAGRSLAIVARAHLGGSVAGRRVLVLAGRGNNGGGGLVAARRLAAWGAQVQVILSHAPDQYEGVAGEQLRILIAMGITPRVAPIDALPETDILLTALLGYGLSGAPREPFATLIRQANATEKPILALDTPSGLDTSTGETPGEAIRATATVTLALPKTGLLVESARPFVGDLYVADIGVPPQVYERMGIHVGPIFAQEDIIKIER